MTFEEIVYKTINSKDDLKTYLKKSIESETDKNKLCLGWEYIKNNLTEDLGSILLDDAYKHIVYNSENVSYILNSIYTTDEINEFPKELYKQLGSFVYVWKDIKRNENKKEEELKLKLELEKEGFKEMDILNKDSLSIFENGLKVVCCFDRDKIGLLGSFTKKEKHEGRLRFFKDKNLLFFFPKRHTRTGQTIKSKFYYKEILKDE